MNAANPRLPDETLVDIAGRIAHIGGWIAEPASGHAFWSKEVCDIHGVPHGTSPTIAEAIAFYPPEWRPWAQQLFDGCVQNGTPVDAELQIISADGKRKWVRVIAEAVYGAHGEIVRAQGAFQDISAAKQSEHHRNVLDHRLATMMESITDAVLMVDRGWRFCYLNSYAERLLQCKREDVIGTVLWDRFPDAIGGRYYREYHRAMRDNVSVWFEDYYAPLDLWTEIRAYPSEDGLAIYFLDISERKSAEEKINTLAYFDKLTGLPNREMLLDYVLEGVRANRRDGHYRALLIIDLDNFKIINDTRGHDKGDELLLLVAARLREQIDTRDILARFGGDEFVILLHDLGNDGAAAEQAARATALRIVDSLAPSFAIAGLPEFTSASIGLTLFDGEVVSPDELLKRADLAMYHAKAAGRNTYALFTPDMQARLADRVALETDLRQALALGHFVLHYQPLARVDGSMTGVEALVRWNHPTRGLVPPNDFIPLAEESGLILPLGQWVMHTACELLARWAQQSATAQLTMAVNVSAHQLHRTDFVAQVQSVLAATGAPPQRLKLELTESLLVNDVEGTIAKMAQLNAIGVRFSLDDFGTGYSSLSYLHRLPLSQLKIDKSFVRDALGGQQGAAIAHTILALGKALKLSVLAEGVETAEQHAFIAHAGCGEYQGYLYSRPLTEAALVQFIQAATESQQALTLPP
ncbi:bifunctional diguanylate cyclase/phosphodiesterase [Massilia sp. CF038]|uniref:putative bifunctional diguanylate cyclase/phosphodiesterase n=1 Tax=Massilia sp. CF038 TaxID=1881045 RepID=UPI00091288B8|nr:bifunctional diguanylate cyclase/phosphodiesterase [Massilia sp. CF038]SHG45985.1 diguanylate cyclase (GGDEF) domain-containing protein [Massilia sp. CF038]